VEVVEFASWLPTLTCLVNPALKFRHWDSIDEKTGGKLVFKRDLNFSIKDLKDSNVCFIHMRRWGGSEGMGERC
jgi:hypothetical protein